MNLSWASAVVQLPRPIGNARSSWSSRHTVFVTISAADGFVGKGEATPLPGYSPDDVSGVVDALSRCPMDVVVREESPGAGSLRRLHDGWRDATPAARFAVETALMDLWSQRLGQPVHRLLTALAGPSRRIPLAALLPADPIEGWVDAGLQAVARGYRTLKIKLGRPGRWPEELAGIAGLRAAIGPDVALRMDVNGGWSVCEAQARLAQIARFHPEFVEEPVPVEDLCELPGTEVPLALDETLQRPDGMARVEAAARRGLCSTLILKPTVLGGFSGCASWSALARALGLGTVVTHTFDGPTALAAACELALALPASAACGLDPVDALTTWPDPTVGQVRPPWVLPLPAAGLRGGCRRG